MVRSLPATPRVTWIATTLVAIFASASVAPAEDGWRPFIEPEKPPRSAWPRVEPKDAPPAYGEFAPRAGAQDAPLPTPADHDARAPMSSVPPPVERADLPPALASDGSGLPFDLWRGLDGAGAEQLMAGLIAPSQSRSMRRLWQRLLTSSAGEPAGVTPSDFAALRAEALYQSGLVEAMGEVLAGPRASERSLVVTALAARRAISFGDRGRGCQDVKTVVAGKDGLPKQLRGEMLALAGYCASAAGNRSGAALAVDLAREEGLEDTPLLEALDALGSGRPWRPKRAAPVTPVLFRVLQAAGSVDPSAVLERADAPLLAVLVLDPTTDARLRLAAAEAAARLNVVAPDVLAAAWSTPRLPPGDVASPLDARTDPLVRRALLFQAARDSREASRRAPILRALLDDARRGGLYVPALAAVAGQVEDLARSADGGWLSETAIEAALASGNPGAVRAWVGLLEAAGRGASHRHWLALADIADVNPAGPRGAGLAAVEELALSGRFSAPVLHRLVTVLDALDYNVPMALWQAASRAPQPNNGFLPETGVLSKLKEASTRREFARTVLLVMRAIGPQGAEGAHIIALGDAIRALRRVGLEAEARSLGLEALFMVWPRTVTY